MRAWTERGSAEMAERNARPGGPERGEGRSARVPAIAGGGGRKPRRFIRM